MYTFEPSWQKQIWRISIMFELLKVNILNFFANHDWIMFFYSSLKKFCFQIFKAFLYYLFWSLQVKRVDTDRNIYLLKMCNWLEVSAIIINTKIKIFKERLHFYNHTICFHAWLKLPLSICVYFIFSFSNYIQYRISVRMTQVVLGVKISL